MNNLSPKIISPLARPLRGVLSPTLRFSYKPLLQTYSTPNKPISTFKQQERNLSTTSFNFEPASSLLLEKSSTSTQDTNVADSKQLFDRVWEKIENEVGLLNFTMPRDILFLIGAPGSGKGTVTPHIIEAQRSTNTPICMSSLLKSPAMKELIDQGKMIDDATVLEHLIFACMERDQSVPLIVDGFPRTQVQVDCLVHLSNKLKQLNQSSLNTGLAQRFPLPSFKVAILYISKQTSLVRQMQRGMEAKLHNQKVLESGKGSLIEERCTDLSEQLVLTRYKAFEQNMGSVTCLMKHFPFHMINADCQLQEVISNLLEIFNSSYPQPESSQLNPIQSKNAKPIWHGFKNSNHSALESFFI